MEVRKAFEDAVEEFYEQIPELLEASNAAREGRVTDLDEIEQADKAAFNVMGSALKDIARIEDRFSAIVAFMHSHAQDPSAMTMSEGACEAFKESLDDGRLDIDETIDKYVAGRTMIVDEDAKAADDVALNTYEEARSGLVDREANARREGGLE